MSRRKRRREGPGAIVRAIERQGDRIVEAIEKASARQSEDRVEMIRFGGQVLRDSLDLGAGRAVVVEQAAGRTVVFTGNDTKPPVEPDEPAPPTTPRGGPANDRR